ncbi:hypothetical protein GLP40_11960 [Nocardia sp. CT2-14]|uniref:Uncharacterized protein n=1 Tax=Nocardia aurantiaca TaxID=2675850 RepID=A0A6I3KXZ6_9NOCA|nr:hypothetical protein [Nocardia aurantiaca]
MPGLPLGVILIADGFQRCGRRNDADRAAGHEVLTQWTDSLVAAVAYRFPLILE